MRRTRNQAGFTIIELMGVIMIMGVLTALVLPSVRSNAVRAKMSEAIMAFGPCRNMVSEIYLSGSDLPPPGEKWGCEIDAPTQYVGTVTVDDTGRIRVFLQGFLDGRLDTKDITLTPLDNTGTPLDGTAGAAIRSWRCGSITDGTDMTLLPYLPSTCRG